jgi:hypothetical protein
MAPKKVQAVKAAASTKSKKEEKPTHVSDSDDSDHEKESDHEHDEDHEEAQPPAPKKATAKKSTDDKVEKADDKPEKAKPMRKPNVTGTNFGKEFEHTLRHKYQIKADAGEILSALFETIKTITEQTIQTAEDDGLLINVAKKGISINMPGFDESGENIKNTIKFDVKLSKTKKGYVPRLTMALHKKFKDSINNDLASYFESALELIEKE